MLLAVACLCAPASAPADEPPGDKPALPLKGVVLFNSGVGFFEHRAEVEGNAQIDLKFNVRDINDLLKSMVLEDLGGGRISTVTYGSKDPITKTLKTFSIDLTDNPTMAQILGQLRGERVEIEAPNRLTGTIVGLEKRKKHFEKDDETIEIDVLNLRTEEGLKSLPLELVGSIKLLDEKLDKELQQALAVLATGHDTDKKTVTLSFLGDGKRPVHVGYVQESPIWKTSYRLVFKKGESSLLQGWAIVENTTELDWQNVSLTLVSGRPISFVMDLYEPLYVRRPVVEPELFANLRPQKYEQDIAQREGEFRGEALKERLGRIGGMANRNAPQPAAAPALEASDSQANGRFFADAAAGAGVESAAQAGDVGELFQYAIETPVTLERQRSAMLPIVNGPVEVEKLSIYDQSVDARHPLNGFKLKNSTGLHLMQGPITVFDGGTYAGDAQIPDLTPDSERLVSYALDLDTEVSPESKSQPEEITSIRLSKGVLDAARKYVRSVEYTIKNSGSEAKQVLIVYPHDPNWKLVKPEKPAETTRDKYRFRVEAKPGEPAKLLVQEEMIARQTVAITSLADDALQVYLSAATISPQVKLALEEVIRQRQALQAISAKRQQLEAQIKAIGEEQARIRENMAQLEKNTELYNRYLKKFGSQEDEIEKYRAEIKKLVEEETRRRESLEKYILGLELA